MDIWLVMPTEQQRRSWGGATTYFPQDPRSFGGESSSSLSPLAAFNPHHLHPCSPINHPLNSHIKADTSPVRAPRLCKTQRALCSKQLWIKVLGLELRSTLFSLHTRPFWTVQANLLVSPSCV